jgi:transcriptional regulator with XRE-family HTH domain
VTQVYTWAVASPEQKAFVGRIVREARLARDLDPRDAAAQAGVARSTFYRWEGGRIGSATVLLLHWLLHDPTESHDAFYWRERALAAEATLDGIERKITQHREDRA